MFHRMTDGLRAQPIPQPFSRLAGVRISAKADYALRAVCELAAAGGGPVKGDQLSSAQGIPAKFLENILSGLRQSGIIRSQRGAEGGYWLARPADAISVADVMRAVDGPLATVRGHRPEDVDYSGAAEQLQRVWIAVRHNLRQVVETVTVADLATGRLPKRIERMAADPEAWVTR
jgi:Rrf2 family protein